MRDPEAGFGFNVSVVALCIVTSDHVVQPVANQPADEGANYARGVENTEVAFAEGILTIQKDGNSRIDACA